MEESKYTLVSCLSQINDPRISRARRHNLIDILVIAVVGTLSGADSWENIEVVAQAKEEWLSQFLELPNGIPSHDTIERVFSRICPEEFKVQFSNWMQSAIELTDGEIVAIDGKVLRRSFDRSTNKSAIHMVSAWANGNGVVMGQVKVDEKSNEITAIPKLLSSLELSGCIVTLDAMGCQKNIAEKVLEKDADYLFGLKGNQSGTLGAVEMCFDTTTSENILSFEDTDGGHGRIEVRSHQVISADLVPELSNWPGCKSAVMVTSKREIKDKISTETRYYISSLLPNPEKAAKAIREHWGIENSLHWVLDMTFNEDYSRVRKKNSPENLAVLRHISLNLLKKNTFKGSLRKKRLMCCASNKYLEKTLSGAL